jgi:anti-sigma regulatory factor (Ser/Thr protein kinase)
LVRSEFGDCEEKVLIAAELMVSELVSNAVVHGSSPIDLELWRAEDVVRATVTDRGAGRPVLRDPRKDEPHGRGLLIVQSLAHDWGIETFDSGKSVWFTLRCQGLPPTSAG